MLAPHDDVDHESSSDSFGAETQTAYQVVDMRPGLEREDLQTLAGDHALEDDHRGDGGSDNPYQSNKEKGEAVSRQSSGQSMRNDHHPRGSFSGNRIQKEVESPNNLRSSIACHIS